MDKVETELAAAWVRGWVVSRGTPRPVPTEWGLRVDVGQPRQVVRHVVFEPGEAVVRSLAAAVSEPATWLKTFVEPEDVRPFLTPAWRDDAPGWIMAVDLSPSDVRLPDGYTAATGTADGVTRVRILAADGSLAAAGQYGHAGHGNSDNRDNRDNRDNNAGHDSRHSHHSPNGATVTIDQISTDPAHQRKGLGSAVMRTLQNEAFAAGAHSAVLGATIEGRALYESLGWKVHLPLAGFVFEG
ncbi:hypothetical protein GCM10009839_71270 [Catenulispora yoronensis]|uniref:N-acetyltransferase domain-containing protein n=1 Tax=Catenulispora yoronensis TaxID=450799 RepID=A0ABP5GSX8_9ACTN